MNLIKYQEEKGKINKLSLANIREEGRDCGSVSTFCYIIFLSHLWLWLLCPV